MAPYNVGDLAGEAKRSAPAALRNRGPIADVLREWLPDEGQVLEIASGSGEHAVHFARTFPHLEWQPSDRDSAALESILAWRAESGLPNLLEPVEIDAASPDWPVRRADALLSVNMAHISPWEATLGLLAAARRLLAPGAPLIFYGPWLKGDVPTAQSNLDFDADLRRRNPSWGLRRVEDLEEAAWRKGLALADWRFMPANNLMLLFRRQN